MLEMCSTIRRILSKIWILFQNLRRNLLVRKIARRIKKIIFSIKLFYNHIFHERYSDMHQDRKKRIMIIIFESCKAKLSLKCEVHPVYWKLNIPRYLIFQVKTSQRIRKSVKITYSLAKMLFSLCISHHFSQPSSIIESLVEIDTNGHIL